MAADSGLRCRFISGKRAEKGSERLLLRRLQGPRVECKKTTSRPSRPKVDQSRSKVDQVDEVDQK